MKVEADTQDAPRASALGIPRSSLVSWGLPLLILAVAAGLRIARINYDGLTFDEQWHLELSTGRGSPHVRVPEDVFTPDAPAVTSLVGAPPWYKVWTNMDFVVHPPLYCTLLRLWRDVFGGGDIAARSFSITCTLIAIGLMFLAGKQLHGVEPAAWAGLIFAVAPAQVFMAQQVRGYDLLLALSMAALYIVVRIERTGRASAGAAVGLGLCFLSMMLTHYFALGACAAIGLYAVIRLRGAALRNVILAAIAAAVLFSIVWLPFMWQQRTYVSDTADPWLLEKTPEHTIKTLGRLMTAPWRLLINYSGDTWLPLLAGAVLIMPLLRLRRRPDLLLWCIWIAGTLGFVTTFDLFRSSTLLRFLRYISLAGPAVFMLFSTLLPLRQKWLERVLCTLLVIACIWNWRAAYVPEEPADWPELGRLVDQHVQPGETLIFYPGIAPRWHIEVFYLGSAHYSHAFPRDIVKLTRPASASLLNQISRPSAWLISAPLQAGRGYLPRDLVPQELVDGVLPGAKIIDGEQYVIPDLAILTHVALPPKE